MSNPTENRIRRMDKAQAEVLERLINSAGDCSSSGNAIHALIAERDELLAEKLRLTAMLELRHREIELLAEEYEALRRRLR